MVNEYLHEGDILRVHPNGDRNAIPLDSQRWPGGVIPYVISPELARMRYDIRQVMKHISDHTCLRFEPRISEPDYVRIFFGEGCYSYVGRIGREQGLSLGRGCEDFGTILHELLHAVGFEHEHNRSDRDDYVVVHWENIPKHWHSAFQKLRPEQNRLLSKFDYSSIMLYGSNSFAKEEGLYSMTGKDGRILPEAHDKTAMSILDVKRINILYDCDIV